MGIGIQDLRLILELRRMGLIPNRANVVEIGAQQLGNDILADRRIVDDLGRAFGATSKLELPKPVTGDNHVFEQDNPLARDMWGWLGCSYCAVDIDNTPGNIRLDLNYDGVPTQMKNRFHLVTNYGTTEHIANQLNAFKVIHDLVVPGGVMVHCLPAQGFANHGLVNYNPKFFWTLARSNGYGLVHMGYFGNPAVHEPLPKDILDEVRKHGCDFMANAEQFRQGDSGLVVSLQKRFYVDYVPPLDVPNGTTSDGALLERYWTVFKPNAFDDLPSC